MKKIILSTLMLLSGAAALAEELEILSLGYGIPGIDEPPLMGLTISPNGKYVAGSINMGDGIFIIDRESGEGVFKVGPGELRDINNDGVAVGFSMTYSFDGDQIMRVPAPEDAKYVICEGITNDGGMMIGSVVAGAFTSYAAYRVGEGEWKRLPFPTDEQLGPFLTEVKKQPISYAKFVSADGKIIYGCLGSFLVPTLWVMNDEGEYEVDFFPERFVRFSDDEDKPLDTITALYGMQMSNNGRYLVMQGMAKDTKGNDVTMPAVYDTTTKELRLYNEYQPVDSRGEGLWPTAIADDGTIIGCVGMPYYRSEASFIIPAGKTTAETFSDAFPEYGGMLGTGDRYGFAVPTSISADGRYITGYDYYSDDYNDTTTGAYYVTFVIDRGENTGVSRPDRDSDDAFTLTIHTLDGRRISEPAPGLNIIRMSDGSVRKVMK